MARRGSESVMVLLPLSMTASKTDKKVSTQHRECSFLSMYGPDEGLKDVED